MKYYFLLQKFNNSFSYNDLDNFSIEIQFINHNYRIDIKDRYKTHNFWYFDEDKFKYIDRYVCKIIESQYESIIKRYKILSESDGAYSEREPIFLYESMNREMREEKLERITE